MRRSSQFNEVSSYTSSQPEKKSQTSAKINRLVFSGGGSKGVVYPGAYRALKEADLLHGVEQVSGASAGALTAALIAIDVDEEKFSELVQQLNFKKVRGEKVTERGEGKNRYITSDGAPLLAFMRSNINSTIRTYLKGLPSELPPEVLDLKRKFQDNHTQPSFTFADLQVLHVYDPTKFKHLTITAVTHPDGALQVFNSQLTPNVEIALACRASASIPAVFEPVKIKIGNNPEKAYVDGGLFDNTPADYFDVNVHENGDCKFTPNTLADKTLIFAFGEGLDQKENEVHQALHGAPRWDEFVSIDALINIMKQTIQQLSCEKNHSKITLSALRDSLDVTLNEAKDLPVNSRLLVKNTSDAKS